MKRNKYLNEAIKLILNYVQGNFDTKDKENIFNEINLICHIDISEFKAVDDYDKTYKFIQDKLGVLNENDMKKKERGVYYTPHDVVKFIFINSIKLTFDALNTNNLHFLDLNGIPYTKMCYEKTIFDPTCGAGEFLLYALEVKLNLLNLHSVKVNKSIIKKIIRTIYGNDLNADSVIITKLRLFLCLLDRFGIENISGISEILNSNFETVDYINEYDLNRKFDIIVGNPPYVEDSKSNINLDVKYGNIYANVLENACRQINANGVMAFIIPLSYVSTPRMASIRKKIIGNIGEQYILNYSDRPDCLFTNVHQKLSIIICKKNQEKSVYTGNYTYWYKDERKNLFSNINVLKNNFIYENYIPKIGSEIEESIFKKIISSKDSIFDLLSKNENGVSKLYLNMRAAFWIKSFLTPHVTGEYKCLNFKNEETKDLCNCLFNSSLFWWFWICISDCWHITKKELLDFKVPIINDYSKIKKLSKKLDKKLENTKIYVGTKQTDFEYKHKLCINEIHEIDDFIAEVYGLTEEENLYIKNINLRYRIGGGIDEK